MFRKILKVKNQISDEAAKELLKNNKRGTLCVNGDEGYPYAVPMDFYYEEDENRIYFHSSKKGHKTDSIKADDKVCFTTWDDGYLEDGNWAYHVSSCVAFGRAFIVEDEEVRLEKLRKFGRKYYPTEEELEEVMKSDAAHCNVICIEIEHLSGKKIEER